MDQPINMVLRREEEGVVVVVERLWELPVQGQLQVPAREPLPAREPVRARSDL